MGSRLLKILASRSGAVAAGYVVPQVLNLLVQPILFRSYSVEEFGAYSLFFAIFSTLSVVACLRFELGIPTAQTEFEVNEFRALCVAVSGALLVLGICLLLADTFTDLEFSAIPKLVIAVSGFGFFQLQVFSAIRENSFLFPALVRSFQVILFLVFCLIPDFGLINSFAFSWVVCGGGAFLGKFKLRRKDFSARYFYMCLKKHTKMSSYSSVGALLDSAAVSLPVVLIFVNFGEEKTAYYSQLQKVIAAIPLGIGMAVSQGYFSLVSEQIRKSRRVFELTLMVFFFLAALSIVYLLFIRLFGLDILGFYFGNNWVLSSYFISLFGLPLLIKNTVTPISSLLVSLGKYKLQFFWQFFSLIAIGLTGFISAKILEFNEFLLAIVVCDFIVYGLYIYIILNSAKKYDRNI